MGALGRQSRVEEPLIFVTELVAFFEREAGCAPSSTAHCQIGFQSFEVQGTRIWAEEDS